MPYSEEKFERKLGVLKEELAATLTEKYEIAKSLIGAVPNDVSFEDSRAERLSKI